MSGVDPLVLASASPQRRAILERLGVSFTVRATAVEEIEQGEPERVAIENALLKAHAAHTAGAQEVVIDAIVFQMHEFAARLGPLLGADQ